MHEDAPARGVAPGRVLDGRYRLGGRIARGGMASVHEAHDLRLDRAVAVKIMHSGLGDATAGDDAFAARFAREARAAARLSHPNVVSVYDQGVDDSGDEPIVYLAMELVPGHTLRDTIVKEAPMSPERALAIVEPVLSALGSAHRAGLIHRDVKPENVLIADDGRIKVADFGLAKAISADTQHTATQGVLIGTVSYLAPELVVDGRADARADVYAVGVILYELLTGSKPHTGESPIQVAYRHVHHDVPAPSAAVPGIPPYVDALVARATTRDPSLRPADAGVLLHHVHRVAAALHDGLRDDPELVEDLLPVGARVSSGPPREVGNDTTPEVMPAAWHGYRPEVSARDARPLPEPADTPPVLPRPARLRPPRRRRPLVLALAAVLLAAAAGGGWWWYDAGRYVDTPSVVGLDQALAEDRLTGDGFAVEYDDPRHSEVVPVGEVISSEPAPGDRILPDDTVTLVVSLGPERYDLPRLAGLDVEQAEARLDEVKMSVGRVVERFSERVPAGEVISSDPAFGSKEARDLPVNTVVDLVVSKGRQPIRVADFTGRDADRAREVLERRGLEVEVADEEYSEDVPEGDVISQDPVDGQLFRGDTVSLVVSLGPPLVEVPSVRYSSTDDAVADLEELGLEVEVERATIYLDGNVAWDTSPGAGEMVRMGSTVVLYVV